MMARNAALPIPDGPNPGADRYADFCNKICTFRTCRDSLMTSGILLRKSFWGGERKFLEPLMRFTRGDVRDHIVSSKIDHGPP